MAVELLKPAENTRLSNCNNHHRNKLQNAYIFGKRFENNSRNKVILICNIHRFCAPSSLRHTLLVSATIMESTMVQRLVVV